jgi:hypothetical protein
MACGEDAHRLCWIFGVVSEVPTEVVPRAARENSKDDVVALTGDQTIRDVAPRTVAPHRYDYIVPVRNCRFSEVAFFAGSCGLTIRDIGECVIEEPFIGFDPAGSSPPSRGGIKNDEVSPSAQKVTIGSKVCLPFPYHSSRKG